MKKYNILGFTLGAHSCGMAYIKEGMIVAVIEEERINRIKPFFDYEDNFERYPVDSLNTLRNRYGLDLMTIDYFTSFIPYNISRDVLKAIADFDLPEEKYIRIDHHESHAILSYFFSGFQEDTLAFCVDASGANGYSSKSYLCKNGSMTYLDGITTKRKSLGHFYACLTEFIGFKRLKDEGKIVGLSGHGQYWHDLYNVWKDVIKIEGTKTDEDNHDIELGGIYLEMYSTFFKKFGSLYWKNKGAIEDIAYVGQMIFEQKIIELLNNIRNTYCPFVSKIALSGGVFANVKLNKKINELPWVSELFVLPPMGDEGLPLGCAIGVLKKLNPEIKPFQIPHIYFGNLFSEDEINQDGADFNYKDFDVNFISDLLIDKKILGLYQGHSEHGARALGNRSIICDCTHQETYNILNTKLQRNDYMPFAPSVLDEDVDMIFDVPKSKYTAQFMTLLVDTKPEWRDKIPTIVHPKDKTARIQIVTKESNPIFYDILKAYKNKTGYGILVNTSFNVHNEPIVDSPKDAFNHLRSGIVDYLITPKRIFY